MFKVRPCAALPPNVIGIKDASVGWRYFHYPSMREVTDDIRAAAAETQRLLKTLRLGTPVVTGDDRIEIPILWGEEDGNGR